MMNASFVKTAVIGHPIAHSKSPMIHNYWIKTYGLSGLYEAVDIAPDNLKTGVKRLVNDGYIGFNVTVPHKVAIMGLCDSLDDTARAIGAVNTVSVRDGMLYGANTDSYGFVENLKNKVPAGWSILGKRVLILGAGGAANAIIYALLQNGAAQISVSNRTLEKARPLVQFDPARIDVIDWDDRNHACGAVDLIVNTTALGMTGKPTLDIDLSQAKASTIVHDIVYAPLMTGLLSQAEGLGLAYVTGIGMLLHQARPGFEKWHGVLPEVTEDLERLVLS